MILFSVIIPFYNEEGNVELVFREVIRELKELETPFEIIAIDDASTDGTPQILKNLQTQTLQLRIITNPTRMGQDYSLWKGMKNASGTYCVLMDGDGQVDFGEISKMRPHLDTYDAIFGERQNRQDPLWKKWNSRIANIVRSAILKDGIRDSGCPFKILKKAIALRLPYFRGCHSFIPYLVKELGYKYKTVPIHHRQRHSGKSKYPFWSLYFLRPILDLWHLCRKKPI